MVLQRKKSSNIGHLVFRVVGFIVYSTVIEANVYGGLKKRKFDVNVKAFSGSLDLLCKTYLRINNKQLQRCLLVDLWIRRCIVE